MIRPTLALACLLVLLLGAAPVLAADTVPQPDSCNPKGGLLRPGGGEGSDDVTTAAPFTTGDTFSLDQLETLKNFLPEFLWPERERFFFEGMRLEIGPCFRDFSAPDFFQAATDATRGKATLDANGGLEGYGAGLPFHPEDIAADDAQAGIKWLWNVAMRYQGAGFRGDFRMTDLVGRIGRAEPFEGELFKILLSGRADRADDEYEAAGARGKQFVAGGLFFKPFDAREYAWRQYRDMETLTEAQRSDDLHAYLPQFRKVRRISASQVEGLYMPSFSVGVQPTTQIPIASGGDVGGAGAVGGGGVGGSVQNKRSGYEGLEIRPVLWSATRIGLHDVLTPINSVSPSFPENPDRDFGPWGLSYANDTWDLRRALVLEMTSKEAIGTQNARQLLYVDLQTMQPLYMATFDARNETTNIGVYAGRWSEDRESYPRWPDDEGRAIRVIDSVGAAFANLSESGSWRRESWGNVSTPPPDKDVKRLLSVNQLTKRR